MAIWSLTKAKILNHIETLLRRLTGQDVTTSLEKKIIGDAFNAALVDLCMDAGISSWRFMESEESVNTAAGTKYVDLSENVYNIKTGTVRIGDETALLTAAPIESITIADPGEESSGLPRYYAITASDDAETMRMILYPIPDAVYTISLIAETIPDEDAISGLPAWTHACLKDKATENALRDLGLAEAGLPFRSSYESRKQNAKDHQGHDGPSYINRLAGNYYYHNPEDRCP
jgi:hypothetical protein